MNIHKYLLSGIVLLLSLLTTSAFAEDDCANVMEQSANFLVRFAAKNVQAALVFENLDSAQESLQTFTEVPWVRFVYLFDAKQKLFTHYLAKGEDAVLAQKSAQTLLQADTSTQNLLKHVITVKTEQDKVITIGYLVLAWQ